VLAIRVQVCRLRKVLIITVRNIIGVSDEVARVFNYDSRGEEALVTKRLIGGQMSYLGGEYRRIRS
jgi:hypothetical protein